MNKILCFGDSNTYGFAPKRAIRFDKNTRWTGVLKTLLPENYEVIEAGCNNRTGFCDNPAGIEFTGYRILPQYLAKNPDVSLVIIAIGINDVQYAYDASVESIGVGLKKLIEQIKTTTNAKVLVMAESVIKDCILQSYFAAMFDESSIEKSKYLPEIYKKAAQETDSYFMDLNDIATVSEYDGLHYEAEEHKKIGLAVAAKIREVFKN